MGKIVGYRFHPTPEELIGHFLKKKRLDPDFFVQKIKDVNFYDHEPSELPGILATQADDQDCHFFCEPDYKYGNSKRVNRRTRGGNWKVTGKKRDIKDKHKKVIGWKITLVFYHGSGNSKEARTNWVMHEYHIKHDPLFKREFVVVRVRRNRDTKHDTSSTPNEAITSHDLASNSGNHNTENITLQVESQPHDEFWSLSNHVTSLNRESQSPMSNHLTPLNGESQPPLPNHVISLNGESQRSLPNHVTSLNRESQPPLSNYVTSLNRESQPPLSNHVTSLNRKSQPPLLNHVTFLNKESQPPLSNHVTSLNRESQSNYDISSNRVESQEPLPNHISFNRESQLLLPNYDVFFNGESQLLNHHKQEYDRRNSQCAVQNEFYGKESGHFHSPDFTGAYVSGGGDAEAETIAALLNGFSSMANGEFDFNSLCQSQLHSPVEEGRSFLPVQMGRVV
ncbi:hypothetical protein ACOSQ3_024777 [Xanthoceras sorbifolium]